MRTHPETRGRAGVCAWVCVFTCLALVTLPAERTGAQVGPYAGASVHTGFPAHGCRGRFKTSQGRSRPLERQPEARLGRLPWLQWWE